jgi:hypothetical protein
MTTTTCQRLLVTGFFVGFLVLGVSTYKDYGFTWDERTCRDYCGTFTYKYVTEGDRQLFSEWNIDQLYGSAYVLGLACLEDVFGLTDSRDIYLMRHLVNFLLFYAAVLAFYFLLRRVFGDYRLALLGCLFLVVTPRLFADAFNNPKDLPFLSAFLIGLASLGYLLDRLTWQRALLHGLACGFCIAIRILGILLPCMSMVLIVAQLIGSQNKRLSTARGILLLGIVFGSTTGFTILLWPYLWEDPLRVIEVWNRMKSFPWDGQILYMGTIYRASEVPWHYLIVWIAITTPLITLFTFAVGLVACLWRAGRNPWRWLVDQPMEVAFLGTLVVPLAAILICHSVVYDGWRHVYFVYPGLVYLSVLGVRELAQMVCQARPIAPWGLGLLALLVVCSLAHTAWCMVSAHPYENVYFNYLAGAKDQIGTRFEVDYWGTGCRKALERLSAIDPSDRILIVSGDPMKDAALLLPPAIRERIVFTDANTATYGLAVMRADPTPHIPGKEIDAIRVNGQVLCITYLVAHD